MCMVVFICFKMYRYNHTNHCIPKAVLRIESGNLCVRIGRLDPDIVPQISSGPLHESRLRVGTLDTKISCCPHPFWCRASISRRDHGVLILVLRRVVFRLFREIYRRGTVRQDRTGLPFVILGHQPVPKLCPAVITDAVR